jgi:phosphate transport system permease protein
MVIGNTPQASWSIFAPQYTMAAVIANEFAEAADNMHLSALLEVGLVLFVITLAINVLSRTLLWSMTRQRAPRRRTAPTPTASTPEVGA